MDKDILKMVEWNISKKLDGSLFSFIDNTVYIKSVFVHTLSGSDFFVSALNRNNLLSIGEVDYLEGLFGKGFVSGIDSNMYAVKLSNCVLSITCCYDEWYYVYAFISHNGFSENYYIRCDTFDGVKELFKF